MANGLLRKRFGFLTAKLVNVADKKYYALLARFSSNLKQLHSKLIAI